MANELHEIPIVSVNCELLEVAIHRLSDEMPFVANHMRFEEQRSHLKREMVMSLRSYILKRDKVVDFTCIQVPLSAWDHCKEAMLAWPIPRWLRLRVLRSIRHRKITTTTSHTFLCPHMNIQHDHSPHIRFLYMGDEHGR